MNDLSSPRNVRIRNGQWHYQFRFRGRAYTGPTGFAGDDSNRTAAEAFAAAKRAEVERDRERPRLVDAKPPVVIGGSAPFQVAAEAFLVWAKDVEYRDKTSTVTRLRMSFVSAKEFFGDTPVQAIDVAAVEAYREHRAAVHQVRNSTIRNDLNALSVFFGKYAVKRGLAKSNPLGRGPSGRREVSVGPDRDAGAIHVITPEEERQYFAAAASLHALHLKSFKGARPNMADLARLVLEQGARPEEVLAARVEAFDAAAGTLRIARGKTRSARRALYLTPASVEILKRRATYGSEWLFPSERHPGHHLGKLNTTHDRICVEAGVSFVIYDFRHTFATRTIERGEPVAVVAAILGHRGLQTIHRYVHPSAEAQRRAMLGGLRAVGE